MKTYFFFACSIVLILSVSTTHFCKALPQTTTEPELPRVFLSSAYPATTGAVVNVPAGGNLQTAINNAQPGDTVVLQAGASYTGNFVLPAKTGSDWIIIRTSSLTGISPEGTRISASQAGAMPKLLTPNAAPAIATAAGSHHYRLVGLEIGIANGVQINYGIVAFGDGGQGNLSLTPHDLVIDRCYIHGNATGDVSRGLALNSASTAVVDSSISACHGVGFDTQAIAGWNGPGPFKIVNNYLEAGGENVMFGGADPRVLNLVPSDIEFRRNHCFKPLSWNPSNPGYAGIHWSVKNLFELKNAQRVLIDGNLFEHCWVDGQTGFIIVLTPRNQEGTAPWSTVQDVTFTNNIARHAAAGIQFLGHDDIHPSQQQQRIKVKNNLFSDIGGSEWGGVGRLFQIVGGPANLQIDHNTAFQTSNIITADGDAGVGFVFTNNITPNNDYGVMGSGRSPGNDTLNYYFPGFTFLKNVIIAGQSTIYPAANFFPTSITAVGFVDAAAGNYRLSPTSAYNDAGSDGLDIGADLDAIQSAMGGLPATGNQPPQVTIAASATAGAAPLPVAFTSNASDPDGLIANYAWDFGDGVTATQASVSHVYQSAGVFTARLTVSDNQGATAGAAIPVSITNPPLPAGTDIVMYASSAPVTVGAWVAVGDQTAAGQRSLANLDAGVPKVVNPVASPSDYFEITFDAVAGRAYRLWVRGRAQNDSPYNDSVFVQFSGSVDSAGAPVFRIGTTDATTVNLEDCFGCGLQGWGWQDNGWGVGVMGPLVYFAATGSQTLRVQVREDGLSIDQIVLSPQSFLSASPGALKNDTTILAESSGINSPTVSAIMPAAGPIAGGTSVVISGQRFAPGAGVKIGGIAATSILVDGSSSITAVTPSHGSGAVNVEVTNPDSQSANLVNGYLYQAPNQPPQVTITASTTSGTAPLSVNLAANASDPDGSIVSCQWLFGDGQSSTLPTVTHLYQSPGSFAASVTVTDNKGATASASVTIAVAAAAQPKVRVLFPNGRETLQFDSTVSITWSVADFSPARHNVYLSLNGGSTWTLLASGLPAAARSFSWRVPKTQTTTARVKVVSFSASGLSIEDTSDANFAIRKRLSTITLPKIN